MSKERLKKHNYWRNAARYEMELNASLVQENKRLLRTITRKGEDADYLKEQNKRYREALQQIKEATSHNKYWKQIAFEALEELE